MAQMNDSIASRSTPKDTHVMAEIIKEMGINEYEPQILNQMLEFTYRYVSNIIDDAQLYSSHAKKKSIDSTDVQLSISLLEDRNFTNAPNRELTVEMARLRNNGALPLIKSSAGLRLPPDRYSLTACNYRLKSTSKKSRTVHTVSRLNIANITNNSGNKGAGGISSLNKSGPMTSTVSKANNASNTLLVTRPITTISKPVVSTPIIKFTDGNKVVTSTPTLSSISTVISTSNTHAGSVSLNFPTVGVMNTDSKVSTEVTSLKRKREDDDYD